MVRELKGLAKNDLVEKSRFVICGDRDDEELYFLTQSPTLQRAAQRLAVALAPSLSPRKIILFARDIIQAYVQSLTSLNRVIVAKLPREIAHLYPPDTVILVIKPLYGLAESGTHWWSTYFKYHCEKLKMEPSTFDQCLLITTAESGCFGIIGIQTDDTLGLGDKDFLEYEETELRKAGFAAKPKQVLTPESPIVFNGCILSKNTDGSIDLKPKGQSSKLILIDSTGGKKEYVEQREGSR
ncbi:uncharacterized protein CPUR_05839 [Claviceps purpurea 20.1]|uniref:Uncharacterized protein n=1 Tax=Claviceps purpurea (strain 20.1) TaxID=1111077 RepID=M1W2M4_CLAP2|nr:uncharacterized protein CPUR_05839 [Claviceps purpurea 20.1]